MRSSPFSPTPEHTHTPCKLEQEGHPECPERIHAIQQALSAAGLDQDASMRLLTAQELAAWQGEALLDALQLVHPRAYLERLDSICRGLQVSAMPMLPAMSACVLAPVCLSYRLSS
jgi:acetoin utilization deacetylase AcuC-like enzyme